jgi:Flp pilus assembly protein TadG
MKRFHRLRRDERGAAVVELALSLPILVTVIYGIFQMSLLMEADSSMQHALGEGARYASLCIPTSTGCDLNSDTNVRSRMQSKLFGTLDGTFNVQTPVTAYQADGTTPAGYKTLTITYTQTMNFLFFTGPSVTLTRSKLVYTPAAN